jgi:nucleotide-binding universal stress UspA family protein
MIIVGTDFSATALFALSEARALAKRLNTDVEVVHVRQIAREAEWEPSEDERMWLIAGRVAEFNVEVRRGTAWVELVRIASEWRAHLIVIGTHGQSGFQPLGLGSTAQRLVLLSPIPTVLVGSRERPSEDGSDWFERNGANPFENADSPDVPGNGPRRLPLKRGRRDEE